MEPLLSWFRSFGDPLSNPKNAGRWISSLASTDPLVLQRDALDIVAQFPGRRRQVGVSQVEALLRIDARLEGTIAQLTQQYTATYGTSSSVESRLWHAVFDLVKAFTATYQATLKAGYPHAHNKRWRAVLPWVLVRLAHFKAVDGKFRLFRYGQWIPSQWRELHELYDFARMRGWQREQLVFGSAPFSRPGVCVEQEYLQTLLLMRLDSGNFTPDQVEWVARQLEDWAPSLALVPPPGEEASFYVDLTGTQGLRRLDRPHAAGGRLLFLDTRPVYQRVVERMRWLPEQDDETAKPGEMPPREQRLLLMRLASLFGPDALAMAPRAPRYATDVDVRVVVGLQSLCRAVAEIPRLPENVRTPALSTSYDEVTQVVTPSINPESVTRRVRGSVWKMLDRSDTGCRLIAPAADAPHRLGELLALKEEETWSLAVVRRMQKQQIEESTIGVEIVARRLVRVLLRNWLAPSDAERSLERPFFGIYLPAHPENRRASQRSLIGPDDKFVPGGMVELDTGTARYLIRFTHTFERQPGWAWAAFAAVRKLG
jgi:hypothetical protein